MESSKERIILNEEQENATFCTENAVVAAGAGSGKTAVLASRYLWLVTEKKYRVRAILTLTFTKKAAAQMYQRIYQMLSDAAKEDPSEKGKLAQQAIDEFAQARIQTLDSYSTAIVKQAANRYGINPDFTIDEDRCRKLAQDEALPFLISHRNHPALECLFSRKSPVTITKELFATTLFDYTYIDSKPDYKRDTNSQCTIACNEWGRQSSIIRNKLNELTGAYEGNEKYHQDVAPLLKQYNSGLVVFPST